MGKEITGYDERSIQSLKNEQQVRQRPAVIFGTDDEIGCAHGIFEIIANSIDEAREGHGDTISITIEPDGTIEVQDNGRGVPMGWNEGEGKYNWELVFCTLYASGKYDTANYGQSLGLNGLGATAIQYASEFMIVDSVYAGETHHMEFRTGTPVGEMKVTKTPGIPTGTKIRFKPDSSVFSSIEVPAEFYISKLRKQAMVQPGLTFKIKHPAIEKTIALQYKGGAAQFIDEAVEHRMMNKTVSFKDASSGYDDERNTTPYKLDMEMAFNFSTAGNLVEMYHNGSEMTEGGATLDALRLGMLAALEAHGKDTGKLSKSDKISTKDYESLLCAIGSTNCPGNRTSWKNQTKLAINNPFIKRVYTQFVHDSLRGWLRSDKTAADRIMAFIIANKQSREEAEKINKRALQALSKDTSGLGNMPAKFVNCSTKDVSQRELYIVEGDSALGACKLSRNAVFQAIMPVRGKILNCLKEDLTRIFMNDIIIDLLRVLKCGVEVESEHMKDLPKFSLMKLNWSKVIICTDADLDGYQIRVLIMAMIYRLCPTLLKAGKVFIAETPLFELTTKDNTYFAYNQAEKDAIMARLETSGYKTTQIKVQRSKGLGENDPEMMSVSTMHPDTRRLVPIEYPEDDTMVKYFFEALLGNDIEGRRELVEEYFAQTKVDLN